MNLSRPAPDVRIYLDGKVVEGAQLLRVAHQFHDLDPQAILDAARNVGFTGPPRRGVVPKGDIPRR
jgi:hypothetical protein